MHTAAQARWNSFEVGWDKESNFSQKCPNNWSLGIKPIENKTGQIFSFEVWMVFSKKSFKKLFGLISAKIGWE